MSLPWFLIFPQTFPIPPNFPIMPKNFPWFLMSSPIFLNFPYFPKSHDHVFKFFHIFPKCPQFLKNIQNCVAIWFLISSTFSLFPKYSPKNFPNFPNHTVMVINYYYYIIIIINISKIPQNVPNFPKVCPTVWPWFFIFFHFPQISPIYQIAWPWCFIITPFSPIPTKFPYNNTNNFSGGGATCSPAPPSYATA